MGQRVGLVRRLIREEEAGEKTTATSFCILLIFLTSFPPSNRNRKKPSSSKAIYLPTRLEKSPYNNPNNSRSNSRTRRSPSPYDSNIRPSTTPNATRSRVSVSPSPSHYEVDEDTQESVEVSQEVALKETVKDHMIFVKSNVVEMRKGLMELTKTLAGELILGIAEGGDERNTNTLTNTHLN